MSFLPFSTSAYLLSFPSLFLLFPHPYLPLLFFFSFFEPFSSSIIHWHFSLESSIHHLTLLPLPSFPPSLRHLNLQPSTFDQSGTLRYLGQLPPLSPSPTFSHSFSLHNLQPTNQDTPFCRMTPCFPRGLSIRTSPHLLL